MTRGGHVARAYSLLKMHTNKVRLCKNRLPELRGLTEASEALAVSFGLNYCSASLKVLSLSLSLSA